MGPGVPASYEIAVVANPPNPSASERLVSGTTGGGAPFIDIDGDGNADATNAWTNE